jgi:hypothetical protein
MGRLNRNDRSKRGPTPKLGVEQKDSSRGASEPVLVTLPKAKMPRKLGNRKGRARGKGGGKGKGKGRPYDPYMHRGKRSTVPFVMPDSVTTDMELLLVISGGAPLGTGMTVADDGRLNQVYQEVRESYKAVSRYGLNPMEVERPHSKYILNALEHSPDLFLSSKMNGQSSIVYVWHDYETRVATVAIFTGSGLVSPGGTVGGICVEMTDLEADPCLDHMHSATILYVELTKIHDYKSTDGILRLFAVFPWFVYTIGLEEHVGTHATATMVTNFVFIEDELYRTSVKGVLLTMGVVLQTRQWLNPRRVQGEFGKSIVIRGATYVGRCGVDGWLLHLENYMRGMPIRLVHKCGSVIVERDPKPVDGATRIAVFGCTGHKLAKQHAPCLQCNSRLHLLSDGKPLEPLPLSVTVVEVTQVVNDEILAHMHANQLTSCPAEGTFSLIRDARPDGHGQLLRQFAFRITGARPDRSYSNSRKTIEDILGARDPVKLAFALSQRTLQ